MVASSVIVVCFLCTVSGLKTDQLEDFESSKAFLMFSPRIARVDMGIFQDEIMDMFSPGLARENLPPSNMDLFQDEVMDVGDQDENLEKPWEGEKVAEEPSIKCYPRDDPRDDSDIFTFFCELDVGAEDEDTKLDLRIGLYLFWGLLCGLAILYFVLKVVEKVNATRGKQKSMHRMRVIQRI